MGTYNREQLIDTYLKSRFGGDESAAMIDPSPDFLQRTMKVVVAYDRSRQRVRDIAVVALAALPVFARQTWMWLRNDSFNVASVPVVGETVASMYQFALSAGVMNGLILTSFLFLISYMTRRPWLQRKLETVFQAIS